MGGVCLLTIWSKAMLFEIWWWWSLSELIGWPGLVGMNSGEGSEVDGDELVRFDDALQAIHMQGHG